MLRTLGRFILRLAGWLLTPIAATIAAALGATVGTMVAPLASPTTGLFATVTGGVVGAAIGLWLWLRLVRATPELQDVLAVTADGVPTEEAIDALVHPDAPEDPPSS